MIRMAPWSRQGGASRRPCSTWCPEALPTVPGSQDPCVPGSQDPSFLGFWGPRVLETQGPRVPGSQDPTVPASHAHRAPGILLNAVSGGFPGHPGIRTRCSHCPGPGFDPGSGN